MDENHIRCKRTAVAALRVNVKSLAAEARIIRTEIQKLKRQGRQDCIWALNYHRISYLRSEARSSQLALAAIRGAVYERIERTCRTVPNWKRVREKVGKHIWVRELRESAEDWIWRAERWAAARSRS